MQSQFCERGSVYFNGVCLKYSSSLKFEATVTEIAL